MPCSPTCWTRRWATSNCPTARLATGAPTSSCCPVSSERSAFAIPGSQLCLGPRRTCSPPGCCRRSSSALVPFGMNVQRAGEVLRLLNNYVVGMTLREAAESRTAGRHRDTGYDAAVAGYLHQIILSGRYPAFSQLATIILEGRDLDPDQSFDLGLQCLLDGV